MASAPPGWYPDPYRQAPYRWWDGRQWTPYASGPPGPPPATPAAVRSELAGEVERTSWASASLVLFALAAIASAIAVYFAGRTIATAIDNLGPGHSPVFPWPDLFAACEGLASIGFLRWQLQAARTARLLGLPAALSPGLGVGGWFIPVVSLWFPYQALRDCLPAAHPARPEVLRLWIAYLVLQAGGLAMLIAGLADSPAAIAVGAVIAVGWAVLVARGLRMIGVFNGAHAALAPPG